MPWVISFIISWSLFFLLMDKKRLPINIFAGLLALALASLADWGGQRLQLYYFSELIIPLFGCSAFYKFGPILTMGILFAQAVPNKKWWQALNIFAFSTFFIALEYLITLAGVGHYIHWHILASYFINILAFTAITWFTTAFLKN